MYSVIRQIQQLNCVTNGFGTRRKKLSYAISIFFAVLLISSCSQSPVKTVVEGIGDAGQSLDQILAKATAKQAQIDTLEADRSEAKSEQIWSDFVRLSNKLWRIAPEDLQEKVELDVWTTLSDLDDETLKELATNNPTDFDLLIWLELIETSRLYGLTRKQAITDISTLYPHMPFNKHLIPQLQAEISGASPIKQVAVLLPLKGKYQQISEQIRNGILKAYFNTDQTIKLNFYDTSDNTDIVALYLQAKEDGADWVIGPLRKPQIYQLALHNPADVMALNYVPEAKFAQFSYRSPSESAQISYKLCKNKHKRIGILSSNAISDTTMANQIQHNWLQVDGHRAVVHSYPKKRPNLRKALGTVINETTSNARAANLKWVLGTKFKHIARTRKDLDAIVLVGNQNRVAVFQPQFNFFQLNLPVYGTAQLTPKNLIDPQTNRDLKKVTFPTMRAVLNPNHIVATPFEAFGWDSLNVILEKHKLSPNLMMNESLTGHVIWREDNLVDRKFEWVTRDYKGALKQERKIEAHKPIEVDLPLDVYPMDEIQQAALLAQAELEVSLFTRSQTMGESDIEWTPLFYKDTTQQTETQFVIDPETGELVPMATEPSLEDTTNTDSISPENTESNAPVDLTEE